MARAAPRRRGGRVLVAGSAAPDSSGPGRTAHLLRRARRRCRAAAPVQRAPVPAPGRSGRALGVRARRARGRVRRGAGAPPGGGHAGQDPYAAGAYHGGNFYNAGTYRYGVARSAIWQSAQPFDRVVPSFEALTPPGRGSPSACPRGWMVSGPRTTRSWCGRRRRSRRPAHRRRPGRRHGEGAGRHAGAEQEGRRPALRGPALLAGRRDASRALRRRHRPRLAVRAAKRRAHRGGAGQGTRLPKRSQMSWPGNGWCSPTSTSMISPTGRRSSQGRARRDSARAATRSTTSCTTGPASGRSTRRTPPPSVGARCTRW